MPMSTDKGCAWMVVERAYTIDPSSSGVIDAPRWRHRSTNTFLLPVTGRNDFPGCDPPLTNNWLVAPGAP